MAGASFRPHEQVDLSLLIEYAPSNSESADQSPTQLTARGSEYSSEQVFIHFGFGLRF